MPVKDTPMVDAGKPSQTVMAWAWVEEYHIYPAHERIVLRGRIWESEEAAYLYTDTARSTTRDLVIEGEAYRQLVIDNPTLFIQLSALADPHLRDAIAHPTLGPGVIVPATLPAWALQAAA